MYILFHEIDEDIDFSLSKAIAKIFAGDILAVKDFICFNNTSGIIKTDFDESLLEIYNLIQLDTFNSPKPLKELLK